jgi:hypothetical protein
MKSQLITNAKENSGIADSNNCTICALAHSAGITYRQAFDIGKAAGRRTGKGFATRRLIAQAIQAGFNFQKVTMRTMSIANFCKANPRGRFVCRRSGHAFTVIDGVVTDHLYNKPLQRVTDAWEYRGSSLAAFANPWA